MLSRDAHHEVPVLYAAWSEERASADRSARISPDWSSSFDRFHMRFNNFPPSCNCKQPAGRREQRVAVESRRHVQQDLSTARPP
jgi:hypothetical protein